MSEAIIGKLKIAILFGRQRFHQYLFRKKFLVETDHKPFKILFKGLLDKCPLRLQQILINQNNIYRKQLYFADTLSRCSYDDKEFDLKETEVDLQLNYINYVSVSPQKFDQIKTKTLNDPELRILLKTIKMYIVQ